MNSLVFFTPPKECAHHQWPANCLYLVSVTIYDLVGLLRTRQGSWKDAAGQVKPATRLTELITEASAAGQISELTPDDRIPGLPAAAPTLIGYLWTPPPPKPQLPLLHKVAASTTWRMKDVSTAGPFFLPLSLSFLKSLSQTKAERIQKV